MGVQACHRIKTPVLVDLTAGVFNGAGMGVTDQNTDKNLVFRGALHPHKGWELTGNYYTGKTNVAEADGGPDRLISNRNLAPLMKRIRTGYRGLRRYGSRRRSVTVRKATGAVFVVLAIECETLD